MSKLQRTRILFFKKSATKVEAGLLLAAVQTTAERRELVLLKGRLHSVDFSWCGTWADGATVQESGECVPIIGTLAEASQALLLGKGISGAFVDWSHVVLSCIFIL